ncbi:MAG: hypothetical protein JSS09_05685, partial [Verrucomicrobia bacterium]|nr:hypothetical protein [Verrucomicrobiota bacterium]
SDEEISNLLNLDEVEVDNPSERTKTLGIFSDELNSIKIGENNITPDLVDIDYSPVLEEAKRRIISCFRENSPELDISLLKISHLPKGLFNKLSQLKKINIYSNGFSRVEKNIFRNLKIQGVEVIGIG